MNKDNTTVPQQNILLDTNIIQYLGNKKIAENLIPYVVDLAQRGFGLAISEISFYELLTGTTVKKEQEGIGILNTFTRYFVELRVLIAASQLSTLYSEQCKKEQRTSHDISLQDKIIAATSILTGSLILTANINDFPRPFFQEAEEKLIFFKNGNKNQMLVLQLLKPNQEIIQQSFQERPIS